MAERPAERAPTAPPVQTGYAPGYGTAMASPWSRRWPLLVGGVAVVVIAISLIILFRGKSDAATTSAPGTSRSPRPVPDEMNQQGPLGQNLPMPPKIDPDDPQPVDRFPTPPGGHGGAVDAQTFAETLLKKACSKLSSCGLNDPTFQAVCALGSLPGMGQGGSGQSCNQIAADACFQKIDSISCDTLRSGDPTQVLSLSNDFMECTRACL